MNDIERIVAIDVLEKLSDREIGLRKGHSKIFKEIIKDIEKQIPDNPKIYNDDEYKAIRFACPRCGIVHTSQYSNGFIMGDKPKYCRDCGQAIDWSVEEENATI